MISDYKEDVVAHVHRVEHQKCNWVSVCARLAVEYRDANQKP